MLFQSPNGPRVDFVNKIEKKVYSKLQNKSSSGKKIIIMPFMNAKIVSQYVIY